MLSRFFSKFLGSTLEGSDESVVSRRRFLIGGAAFGAAGLLPAFMPSGEAFAALAGDGSAATPSAAAAGVQQAQIEFRLDQRRGESGRSDNRRGPDYRDDRRGPYRRDDRRGRRMSRRELRGRCEYDRSFRRDNRGLCREVERRGRQGSCVQIGPFTVCD